MSNYAKEKEILRGLAKQVAEISALPIQNKTLKAYKAVNSLRPERPVFMIDQLPWGELIKYSGDELNLLCEDWLMQRFEWELRETLYRWNHIPDDRVVTNVIRAPKSLHNTGFGLQIQEERIQGQAGTAADSHDYKDILKDEDDLAKVQTPVVSEDKETSKKWLEMTHDIFDGVMRVVQGGTTAGHGHVWDLISTWHGVEECMYDVLDRPEFMHKVLDKMFGLYLYQLDEYERLGIIDVGTPLIHCTGAYTDELPGHNGESDEELEKYRSSAKNMWCMGAAQLFSMVSPELHDEFEIAYQQRWYSRFGLGYYG